MTMNKFIAYYGRKHDIAWAANEADALAMARRFAVADGMSVEESMDEDEVFVRHADFWLLKDTGLIWLDASENSYEEAEARP